MKFVRRKERVQLTDQRRPTAHGGDIFRHGGVFGGINSERTIKDTHIHRVERFGGDTGTLAVADRAQSNLAPTIGSGSK